MKKPVLGTIGTLSDARSRGFPDEIGQLYSVRFDRRNFVREENPMAISSAMPRGRRIARVSKGTGLISADKSDVKIRASAYVNAFIISFTWSSRRCRDQPRLIDAIAYRACIRFIAERRSLTLSLSLSLGTCGPKCCCTRSMLTPDCYVSVDNGPRGSSANYLFGSLLVTSASARDCADVALSADTGVCFPSDRDGFR